MRISIRNTNFLLAIILLLAAVLRLYHINHQSLWLDEIHTINESDPSLTLYEFYKALCNAEPHPPLYFYMARLSFYFFGHTALTIRVLSALLGIAGVWSIYLLGRELHTKKAGLIAALLLAVNYFHIYYSQDARPYPLLFLTTTISFCFLVRFIKNPNLKSSLLYGFFAGVMLYSHLFSLFALCSQCIILLYFVFRPYTMAVTGKKMFLYCLLSAGVVIIMYLPCLEILFISASMKSIWIPKPEPDAYIELLKDFFGNFDIQLVFVSISLVLFVIGLIKENRSKDNPRSLKFVGLILFFWIFITLLLPWIKSYLSLPIIINRYFINVLPAVILLVAIGLMQVKNSLIRYILVALLSLLSLYNIFIRKDYYNTITKTQFREATDFIIKNNKNDAPVVTSLGWYLPFFLKNGTENYIITTLPLESYIDEKILDETSIEPFWYLDGHNTSYNVSDKVKKFLDSNYSVKDIYNGYDIWVKYYEPIDSNNNIVRKRNYNRGDYIRSNIDRFEVINNVLNIKGWAFLSGIEASGSVIKVYLMKDGKATAIPTIMHSRGDVASALKPGYNIDNSGFNCEYKLDRLKSGKYQLAIYIINKEGKKSGLTITDKIVIK